MEKAWLASDHGCGVLKKEGLVCWGQDESGQLGDGAQAPQTLPVPTKLAARPIDVAVAERRTIVLAADGHVETWGAFGKAPADLSGVRMIAGGRFAACAANENGVRCWNASGPIAVALEGHVTALAVGDAQVCAAFDAPHRVRCFSDAVTVPLEGVEIAGLTAGAFHTCALTRDGSIRCWGKNESGQLGDGSMNDAKTPVLVSGIEGGAVEVRAGDRHTCARSRSNTIACWGDNRFHQLADGTRNPSGKPVGIFGLVGVLELVAGGDAACARLADGALRCWGKNDRGQLGDGTTTDHDVPMPVRFHRP